MTTIRARIVIDENGLAKPVRLGGEVHTPRTALQARQDAHAATYGEDEMSEMYARAMQAQS